MADLTMCLSSVCEIREKCYRFTATATPGWQSFFMDETMKGPECGHYIESISKSHVRRVDVLPRWGEK